jgi:hypothetical protein
MSASSIVNGPSALQTFIERRTLSLLNNEDTKCRIIVKRVLQGGSVGIIGLARVGMVMVCFKGAASVLDRPLDDPAVMTLGAISAVGTVYTYGIFSIFTTTNLIDELMKATTPEEKTLLEIVLPTWQNVAIKISSVVIGLIAQVPNAIATYYSAFAYPVLIGGSQELDFGRAAYSTYMTLKALSNSSRRPTYKGIEAHLAQVRDNLVGQIATCRKGMLKDSPELTHFLKEFVVLMGMDESDSQNIPLSKAIAMNEDHEMAKELIQLILAFPVISDGRRGPLPSRSCSGMAIEGIVGLISLAVLAEFWQLAGVASQQISDSEVLVYFFSSLVVLANVYIWWSLIRRSTHLFVNTFRGTAKSSLIETKMVKTHRVYTVINIAMAVPTAIPQMFYAVFLPKVLYWPVGILSALGSVLAGFGAGQGLCEKVLTGAMKKYSPQAFFLKLDVKLQRLSEVIAKTKPLEVARFIIKLPLETRQALQSPSETELIQYLSNHAASS